MVAFITGNLVLLALLINVGVIARPLVALTIGHKLRSWSRRSSVRTD
jgi:hypothetical protein